MTSTTDRPEKMFVELILVIISIRAEMVKSNVTGSDVLEGSLNKLHISELASVTPRRRVHQIWRRRDPTNTETIGQKSEPKSELRSFSRIRQIITSNQVHTYQPSTPIPTPIPTPIHIQPVSEIDWKKVRPLRAGIVVYTRSHGELLFCFGIDATYKTATDFGGGVSYRRDGTALQGGLREFSEESLSAFGPVSTDQVQKGLAIYDENTLIIFLYLDVDPVVINGRFATLVKGKPSSELEISEILWLNVAQMQVLLSRDHSNGGMYNRARMLLEQAGDFYRRL